MSIVFNYPACLAVALSGALLSTPASLTAQTAQAVPQPPSSSALTTAADASAIDAGRSASESSVRIVRLSVVRGEVKLDRLTGNGLETAFANLPIVQGAKLQTAMGIAEIEFEDNSTLRVAPNSLVEFTHLAALRSSGAKVSAVRVLKGTVFASMSDTRDNDFTIAFNQDQLALPPRSHLQLKVADPDTRLVVLDGAVQVTDPTGATLVPKKKGLVFDPASAAAPKLVSASVDDGPLTKWDKDSVSYHKVAAYNSFGAGSSLYGANDLNYYGSFANLGGGCGNVWRPYFASAAWDHFANGVYAYYPGAGYSWVSPYPWGWMPFHTGSWQYCGSGAGWGWQPGGAWNGLSNVGLIRSSATGGARPRPPVGAPVHGSSLLVVNTRPLSVSQFSSEDRLTLHNDSAGLGIPREAFNRLDKLSAGVAQHGTVTATVWNMSHAESSPSAQSYAAGNQHGSPQGNNTGWNNSSHSGPTHGTAISGPAPSPAGGAPSAGAGRSK